MANDAGAIRGLNHAVLYVRDAEVSTGFYQDVLGFETVLSFPGANFLRAPASDSDHDLALFAVGADAVASNAGAKAVGLYHLAWELPTLAALIGHRRRLVSAGALVGESDHGVTKSLYAKDPDGLEFELLWQVPIELLDPELDHHGTRPLDLDAAVARFGPETSRFTPA